MVLCIHGIEKEGSFTVTNLQMKKKTLCDGIQLELFN